MIRGKYLTSMEDIAPVLALRRTVFGRGEDGFDRMAVYALALDPAGAPAGAGRLYIDGDDRFRLDTLGVLKDKRGQGLGDLLLRMLLQRALDLQAPQIVLTAPGELTPFFQRYGFAPSAPGLMAATPQSVAQCGGCSGKCHYNAGSG